MKNQVKTDRRVGTMPLDLVATTVHELKSPLILILGLADLLKEEELGKINSNQRQSLVRITQSTQRLLQIVNSLITINRASHKQLAVESQPVNLSSVIENVLHETKPFLDKSGIKVISRGNRNLPPVLGDKSLLHQLFLNLIDNAAKYAEPKSNIQINYRKRRKSLEVQLVDRGFSVKPTEVKYLFERFGKQVQPIRAHAGSSGLGLFIAKNFANMQGGDIRAKALGEGTCLTIRLPLAQQLALFGE